MVPQQQRRGVADEGSVEEGPLEERRVKALGVDSLLQIFCCRRIGIKRGVLTSLQPLICSSLCFCRHRGEVVCGEEVAVGGSNERRGVGNAERRQWIRGG